MLRVCAALFPLLLDGATYATPLEVFRQSGDVVLRDLFFGFVPGSIGETSALLILAGGIYLIVRKTAPWRLVLSCLLGGGAVEQNHSIVCLYVLNHVIVFFFGKPGEINQRRQYSL